MMKRRWLVFLRASLVLFVLVIAWQDQAGEADVARSDAESLTHIKRVLWPKAYREQNTTLLDQILADEFRSIDANGEWSTKPEELEYVRLNRPSYESLSFTVQRLDVFENGTAIVAGTGTITRADAAGRYVLQYQSSNMFIKRDGRWQAVASHVSGVKRLPVDN
jgi:hypothetical protein